MASHLVGCSQGGSLFRIDPTTGVGSVIGPIGVIGTNSMAKDANGAIYSADTLKLIRIDPQTGAGTVARALQTATDIRGLAFSPAGVLYAIRNGGDPGAVDVPDDLVTIDTGTGAVTLVGSTGLSSLQALEFAPNGTLYAWDLGDGLVVVNPSTGAGGIVNPTYKPSADIQGLAFGPNCVLFGARDALYTINQSTGVETLVGSGGYTDVRGIEFVEDVEEPRRQPWTIFYAWLWMILVGGILITPIGPLCIVCGNPIPDVLTRVIGVITVLLGAAGLRHAVARPAARR